MAVVTSMPGLGRPGTSTLRGVGRGAEVPEEGGRERRDRLTDQPGTSAYIVFANIVLFAEIPIIRYTGICLGVDCDGGEEENEQGEWEGR